MERKYSVDEIDRMRDAVEHVYLFGYRRSEAPEGRHEARFYNHNEVVMAQCVEEQVRTYMLAGVDPSELE